MSFILLPIEKMKRKELKEKFHKAETKEEQNALIEEYWNTNARVRLLTYWFIFIVVLIILWVWLGLFIRIIRLIAF